MFNKDVVLKEKFNHDSFYLYDQSIILKNIQSLVSNFKGIEFLYSMKTNPNPYIVQTIFAENFGCDAASLGEVLISHKNGLNKDMIYYSTPGKTTNDIKAAIDISVIIADSLSEIEKIQSVAEEKGIVAQIGVRINPNFTYTTDKGAPSKFGIDEDLFLISLEWINSLSNIKIIGIHVHSKSQELKTELIENYYKNMFNLSVRLQECIGRELKFVNLGSGIGIPYATTDNEVDLPHLGQKATALMVEFKEKLPNARIFIETGRFIVGKAGVYATKVVDKKISHGKIFVLLTSTLNGFIRPSIAQMVADFCPDSNVFGGEPIFTKKDAFQFIAVNDSMDTQVVTLVGNLCTATDCVAKDITIPTLNIGDMVVITNAGSYAAVLSPMQFSSQIVPPQLFLTVGGEVLH